MSATVPAHLDTLDHLNIQTLGNEWLSGKRQLHESYFACLGSDGDKGPVALPEKYVVIQPYSTNARKVYRDVNTDEWQAILMWLRPAAKARYDSSLILLFLCLTGPAGQRREYPNTQPCGVVSFNWA